MIHACSVCGKETAKYKAGALSKNPVFVCERCYDIAPLDNLEDFCLAIAVISFEKNDTFEVIERNRHIYEDIINKYNISSVRMTEIIKSFEQRLIENNIVSNKSFNTMYKMLDIPRTMESSRDIDPMIHKIYVSPINNYFWCASAYNPRTFTFYGDVLGSGGYDTTFTVKELSSYMAYEYKDIELPKRLSDVYDEISVKYTMFDRRRIR